MSAPRRQLSPRAGREPFPIWPPKGEHYVFDALVRDAERRYAKLLSIVLDPDDPRGKVWQQQRVTAITLGGESAE